MKKMNLILANVLIDQISDIDKVILVLDKIKFNPRIKGNFQKCLIEIKKDCSYEIYVAEKEIPKVAIRKGQKKQVA